MSNFDKLMKEVDINVDRAQMLKESYDKLPKSYPKHDIISRLISEAVSFKSPYLNHIAEFNDLKNHLILFYEEQRK